MLLFEVGLWLLMCTKLRKETGGTAGTMLLTEDRNEDTHEYTNTCLEEPNLRHIYPIWQAKKGG